MPDNAVQNAATAKGTLADQPLTTPVSEVLGNGLDAKLNTLLNGILADEQPEQESDQPAEVTDEVIEEKQTESTSEEVPADAEATDDTNDLSQESEENADKSDSDEDTEETTEEVSAEDTDKDLPRGVKKRISKLSAKAKELEVQLEAERKQLADLKQKLEAPQSSEPPPAPLPSNPYLHLDTQAAVEQEIRQAREVRRWCEENAEGVTWTDPKTGKETEYDAKEIRRIKLNTIDALEDYLPRQLQYVQTRQQIDPLAEQAYPWWKDRTSKEYAQAQKNMLKTFPELRKFPDYKMVVGDYIRGAQERETVATKPKAVAAKPVKKAPAQPTKPISAPVQPKVSDQKLNEAESGFRKRPTAETLQNVVLNRFL